MQDNTFSTFFIGFLSFWRGLIDTIFILNQKECSIFIPNAFSPNGDGRNDIFSLEYNGNIEIEEFRIFDRWGEMVYNNEDPNGWDGKYQSEELPQDVYIYQFVIRLGDNTLETLTGDVTLLR